MAMNMKETQEILGISRIKLLKVVEENKNELRSYLRKGRKGSYNFTKSAMEILAKIFGKSPEEIGIVPDVPTVEEPAEVMEVEKLEVTTENLTDILQMLYDNTEILKHQLAEMAKVLEKEIKTRKKFQREVRTQEKNKAKAIQVLFPFMAPEEPQPKKERPGRRKRRIKEDNNR